MTAPEAVARANIDRQLEQAGWVVQDRDAMNLYAGPGVAVREFPLAPGHGTADYLLYVNRKAVGVVEAKPEGTTLTGVEVHTRKYAEGLPDTVPAHLRPLPFLPEHRRRDAVHQPARPRAAVAPGVHLPSPGDARAVGRGRAGRGARGRAGGVGRRSVPTCWSGSCRQEDGPVSNVSPAQLLACIR